MWCSYTNRALLAPIKSNGNYYKALKVHFRLGKRLLVEMRWRLVLDVLLLAARVRLRLLHTRHVELWARGSGEGANH